MPTSPNLGVQHLAPGQAQKDVTVNEGIDQIDVAIAGLLTKSVAGSANVTLSTSPDGGEADNAIIVLTGAITANIEVIFPNITRRWHVVNNTTGAYSVTLIGTSGTGIAIPQGAEDDYRWNGTNFVAMSSTSGGGSVSLTGDANGPTGANVVYGMTPPKNVLTTAGALNPDCINLIDTTSGAVAGSLPGATGSLKTIRVKKLHVSANDASVAPNGSDQIDDVNATMILADLQAITLYDYGAGKWAIV